MILEKVEFYSRNVSLKTATNDNANTYKDSNNNDINTLLSHRECLYECVTVGRHLVRILTRR